MRLLSIFAMASIRQNIIHGNNIDSILLREYSYSVQAKVKIMPILVKYLFCIICICNKMALLQKYWLCIVNIYMKCKYCKNVDIRLEILAVKLGNFFSNSGQYMQGVNTQIFIYLYLKNIILIFLKLLIFYSYILKTRLFIIKYIP